MRILALLCGIASFSAPAQQYTISTLAGGAPPATPVSATGISIGQTTRVAVDSSGNVYFSSANTVFKLNSSGTLTVVAGNSRAGFSGDGGPAVNAQLNFPQGIALDSAGNIYIADAGNNRVRIVTPDGNINTFAGNGSIGAPRFLGDGGAATDANLHAPSGLAVDSSGNVYIADTGNNSIREVTTDGIINTIAGDGFPSFQGDGNAATSAELHAPQDVALDSKGNIYISDSANARIREVTTDGKINTIAGGSAGYSGDGSDATKAAILGPFALAVDGSGNVYFADNGNNRLRKVDTKGIITTFAGNGNAGFGGDGSAATSAQMHSPTGLALDSAGNSYVADSLNNRIRKIASGGNISTIAGNGVLSYSGDGGVALKAQLNAPQGIAVDSAGNLYISDTNNNVVRKVAANGTISGFAGNGSAGSGGDGGAATGAQLNGPQGLALDASGNLFIADTQNNRVRRVTPGGTISTVAGNGTGGFAGDGGAATGAQLSLPFSLAIDSAGNLYIADFGNSRVRQVSAGGNISSAAGNGIAGYSGDGGPAANAQLNGPQSVAVDSGGNLFIADTNNNAIREVSTAGTIHTVAGTGAAGFSGDGGPATSAQLGNPTSVAVDATGNLYITDGSARVRKIYPDGSIATIAGDGARGYSGDGGAAVTAELNAPTAVTLDAAGNVCVADSGNNAVRLLQFISSGIAAKALTNGASNQTGAIVPGEVVVIYGTALGPAQLTQFQLNGAGLVPTATGGTSVFFNGAPAPVLYSSANQVAAVVPFGITGPNAQVFVLYQGQSSAPITVPVVQAAPTIFTLDGSGSGQAAAGNQDGSINGANHPADAGTIVSLFATGFGQTNPPGQDGLPNAIPLPLPVLPVTVAIGGKTATIQYVGGAPGVVSGVMQVNVVVPSGLPVGSAPVQLQVGGIAAPSGVTIAVSGN